MYVVHIGSITVEVGTIEELREIVREFANKVDAVQDASPKRRKAVPSRGSGPAKLWAMAEWYGRKKGIKKDEARSVLSKMRESDPQAYTKLQAQFNEANK